MQGAELKDGSERERRERGGEGGGTGGLVAGDRVVVVERGHRDVGRVGVLGNVRVGRGEGVVEGVNKVSFEFFLGYCGGGGGGGCGS